MQLKAAIQLLLPAQKTLTMR